MNVHETVTLHSCLQVCGVAHSCKGVSRLRKHANKIQKQFIWECLYHTALMPFKWGGCAPGISTNGLTNDSISVGVCKWVSPVCAQVSVHKRVWYPFCVYAFLCLSQVISQGYPLSHSLAILSLQPTISFKHLHPHSPPSAPGPACYLCFVSL